MGSTYALVAHGLGHHAIGVAGNQMDDAEERQGRHSEEGPGGGRGSFPPFRMLGLYG